MDSEFNSYSFEEDLSKGEIALGESGRFVFSKKRIYGRMHFIKRPSQKYYNDFVTSESLYKEFSIGYSLDHPHIARYLRYEDNTLFEEYIDGKSLRNLMEEDDPRLKNKHFLQNLCFQFLDVLRYLQEMGVVHNDIKPENVMITRIGDVLKLVDFNCAQSSVNDILGGYTSSYKAPEQGKGKIDCSSDLFQVGKVMEELSTWAGYKKNWKRFIEKTTANHPDNRIPLKQAEKLIPRTFKLKKLSRVIISLICLGIIAIIIVPTRQDETENIPLTGPAKDTVVIERILHPEIENTKENPYGDVRRIIDKKILDYTDYYYQKNLYPICRELLENDGRSINADEEIVLQSAIDKAYRSAMEYGEKLSTEYPEERNYIEREVLKSFEMKVSSLLIRIYP